jgi:G:T-mismatch repair DNA endonuclease (very short patch repair protein)
MKNGSQNQRKQTASSVSRSQLMRAIRRKNTNPEMITRKIIHAAGSAGALLEVLERQGLIVVLA